MMRIARAEDGTVHVQNITSEGVFEVEPTANDAKREDGLYDHDWNKLPDDLKPVGGSNATSDAKGR